MQYPKIQTVWKRDITGNVVEGAYTLPEIEYLKDNRWIYEEKIDGMNIRVYWSSSTNVVTIKGRTDKAQVPPFLMKKLNNLFTVEKFKTVFPEKSVILYGEGFGNRIQKSGKKYIGNDVDFILFDVIVERYWLCREDVEDVAKKLNIRVVPIVGVGSLKTACEIVKKGFYSEVAEDSTLMAEGLVLKTFIPLFDKHGRRIMTKIKHKDYNKP